MGLILLLVVLLFFFGSAPAYPYSRGWGYAPMSFAGILVAFLLIALFLDLIPVGFGLHLPWGRPVVITAP